MLSQKQWITIASIGLVATLGYWAVSETEYTPTHMDAETSTWKLYKPNSDQFEVMLPAIPQHVRESHPTGDEFTNYDVYLSQDKQGNVYMISLTQYPEAYDMGNPDDMLEAVKNGALSSNAKNELKEVEKGTYMDLPSIDFFISNNDTAIRSKVILSNNTLIVLTVMNRDEAKINKDFKYFADSFVLKPFVNQNP